MIHHCALLVTIRILRHILLRQYVLVLLINGIINSSSPIRVLILLMAIWYVYVVFVAKVVLIVALGRHVLRQRQCIWAELWGLLLALESDEVRYWVVLGLGGLTNNRKATATSRRYVPLTINYVIGTRLRVYIEVLHFTCKIFVALHL